MTMMPASPAASLVAAIVSATLSYAAALLVPDQWALVPGSRFELLQRLGPADILPGLIFGFLVLISRELPRWAAAVLVVASAAVYWGATETAFTLHVQFSWPAPTACALAGALAAFVLSVLYSRLAGNAPAWRDNLRAAAIGGFAGIVMGFALRAGEEALTHALLLSGYAIWQAGFALVHAIVPRWWPVAARPRPAE